MTAMYTRTVTMCKARHIRNYVAQEIGYNVEFQFDYNTDEVRATFSCSDDYADPKLCHNGDDLTEYIIRRYGAFIVNDNLAKPKNFPLDMKKIGEALTNPLLNKRDNYQDEYTKVVASHEWERLKTLGIRYERRLTTSSYTKDAYEYRIGIWHG